MTKRPTAAAFVGRHEELERLALAIDAARHAAQVVLVSGDAGIGKTRLITEACARCRADGGLAVVGGCVDLGDAGAGYAPLIEVLRHLGVELGIAERDELLGSVAPDVRPLLSGIAGKDVEPGVVLAQTVALVEELGARHPGAVVVFEDLHWADASTQDLVRYLARNLRLAKVALVLSVRTDDLHRRHPVQALVAELQRWPDVDHLALSAMTRSELTVLLAALGGAVPSDAVLDDVLTRSEGNPFYAEELLASRSGARPLPQSLRDTILARVAGLGDPGPEILREAALLGDDIDVRLLAAVATRPEAEVTSALHDAVAHQLLTVEAGRCRFRHALVREAAYEDLLPGERQRLHERAASVIEARPELLGASDHVRWALLARHWSGAADERNALRASVGAAAAAERVGALADAAHHYRRACDLWTRVPGDETLAGVSHVDLLRQAAAAVGDTGHPTEAVALMTNALDVLGEDAEPEERAVLLDRLGRYRWFTCDSGGAEAARRAAVAAVTGRQPSEAQAVAFAGLGRHQMLVDRYVEAEPMLTSALAAADVVGSDLARSGALTSLGFVLAKLGRVDEGVDACRQALAIAEREGTADDRGRAHVMLTATLLAGARWRDAADLALVGVEEARRSGTLASDGVLLAYNRAVGLYSLGLWDEALALAGGDADCAYGPHGSTGAVVAARIALRRGDLEAAARYVARATERPASGNQLLPDALCCEAMLHAAEGRVARARSRCAEALGVAEQADDLALALSVCSVGIEIEADAADDAAFGGAGRAGEVRTARESADELLARARRHVGRENDRGVPLTSEARAYVRTLEADHERAWARLDPEQWAAVAAGWDELEVVHPAAVARFREADGLLRRRGGRERARRVAAAAFELATSLRAVPLEEQIRALAQRGRLDLSTAAPPGAERPDDLGISSREREVLRLLALGRTNRQIAAELFISEKTASVHVSHLLRKLGVTSRIEAAMVGQRAGLGH